MGFKKQCEYSDDFDIKEILTGHYDEAYSNDGSEFEEFIPRDDEYTERYLRGYEVW